MCMTHVLEISEEQKNVVWQDDDAEKIAALNGRY